MEDSMRDTIDKMLHSKTWAVLGATPTTHKFGYKIFKKLVGCHYDVTPINPIYDSVDGFACRNDLKSASDIEVVNVVVAPEIAIEALDDIVTSGIRYVWFQPGAYDDAVIAKAKALNLEIVYGYCVLVELGALPMCAF